jgi:hypothetical protein
MPIGIKPLEWRDHRGHTFPDTWTAKTPCGVYEIEERSASDSPVYIATAPLHVFIADKDSLDEAKAAAQADYEKRIRSALVEQTESCLWALCYLHDWDAPKDGQQHRWEPGKNVFPEVHAFYRSWKDAEAVRCDMDNKDKYWVVRARPESEARISKARSTLIEQPATPGCVAEVLVERVLSELRDRRLLNDVDDDLHQEIAEALIKAVHG